MKTWVLCLLPFSSPAVWGGDFAAGARGTSAGTSLVLGSDARAAALGEAAVALADDASTLYWNPGGLVGADRSALVGHAVHLDNTSFDFAGYVHPIRRGLVVGAAVQYFSAGSIQETDAAGVKLGKFTPYDLAVTLGIGIELDGYGFGAAAKWVKSRIASTARTASFDAGILTPAYLGRVRFGLAIANAGGRLEYDAEKEDLPMTVRLGSAWKVTRRLRLALDEQFARDDRPMTAIGAEVCLGVENGLVAQCSDPFVSGGRKTEMALRVGWNSGLRDVPGFAGFSFGAGFRLREGWRMDYAVVPFGDLGVSHRVSGGFGF